MSATASWPQERLIKECDTVQAENHRLRERLETQRLALVLIRVRVQILLERLDQARHDSIETPEGDAPWFRFEPNSVDEEQIILVQDALR